MQIEDSFRLALLKRVNEMKSRDPTIRTLYQAETVEKFKKKSIAIE